MQSAEQAGQTERETQAPRKLSYKQQRELEKLPQQIEILEKHIEGLEKQTTSSGFYNQPFEQTQPVLDKLQQSHNGLEKLTARWLELEELQKNFRDAKQKAR